MPAILEWRVDANQMQKNMRFCWEIIVRYRIIPFPYYDDSKEESPTKCDLTKVARYAWGIGGTTDRSCRIPQMILCMILIVNHMVKVWLGGCYQSKPECTVFMLPLVCVSCVYVWVSGGCMVLFWKCLLFVTNSHQYALRKQIKNGLESSKFYSKKYNLWFLPNPSVRAILQFWVVQMVTDLVGNLIMMNLNIILKSSKKICRLYTYLQIARDSVKNIETVWIKLLKLMWKSMK